MRSGARSQESGVRSGEQRSTGAGLVFIALGSNLGDSRKHVFRAMAELQKYSDVPLLKSSLWETAPIACPPGSPTFINAVIGMVPRGGETPESLLAKLQSLEKQFGRKPKKVLNEPRALDLDILAFGNELRATPGLVLPHPRAHQRRFVLEPLSEIAPDFILRGQVNTVKQLLTDLPGDPAVLKLPFEP